jgi:hypothetical protein
MQNNIACLKHDSIIGKRAMGRDPLITTARLKYWMIFSDGPTLINNYNSGKYLRTKT